MNKQIPAHKRRCKAMIDAGITDAESHEGIVFCTGDKNVESQCPYDYCVVFEEGRALALKPRKQLASDLCNAGISRYDIALILNVSIRTVERYLKK